MAGSDPFTTDISRHIWETKYRFRGDGTDRPADESIADTWSRIARHLASVEPSRERHWKQRFASALDDFRFLPGGRIHAGAGTGREVTLFNCFVMGRIEDSIDGIFDALKEGARTMQQGGGVGYDFSTLRPKGTFAHHVGSIASGPVSFMRIWDSMCATMLSTGARRGAMMAMMRCDHPDIEQLVTAKQDPHELRHFNVSVQVTDAFMEAVRADREWPLVFPDGHLGDGGDGAGETVMRRWPGSSEPIPCRVVRRVRARELWRLIMRSTYDYAEPGVFFVDRVNAYNNLWYREHITASNPCGEIPLPPYGACDLGSVNLTRFVREPFSRSAELDWDGIRETTELGVRMLDDVVDASRFPLKKQAAMARGTRRIGLGVTGLGDMLIMMGKHYATDEARALAAEVMKTVCHTAYRTSVALAREKQPFPFYDRETYLDGLFIESLPRDIRDGIASYGIRNSHCIAIAPTGTISLLANNVSSGIEPVFDFEHTRKVLNADGSRSEHRLTDYAYALWRREHGDAKLPDCFVHATDVDPKDHLAMEAALQPYVDNAISKTINVPRDYDFDDFARLYEIAYDEGLKGCTTFRDNPVTGAVLSSEEPDAAASVHCCSLEREAD